MGPIVCELDGPMPILNRSSTESDSNTGAAAVAWLPTSVGSWALPLVMACEVTISSFAGGRAEPMVSAQALRPVWYSSA